MASEPKCPMLHDMSNQLAPCDPECMWLLQIPDAKHLKACAVAVLGCKVKTLNGKWMMANYVNEKECGDD